MRLLIAILIGVPGALLVICLILLLKILFIVLDGLKDGQARSPVTLEQLLSHLNVLRGLIRRRRFHL